MKKVINLEDFNNIQDNPNIFFKLINELISKYKLEISEIEKMNSVNRNFKCFLLGSTNYIKLFYDYEENKLNYEIVFENNVLNDEIEKYILRVITKTSYKEGDIVTDIYGNEYKVLEDFTPNKPKHGTQVLKTIKLYDLETDNIVNLSSRMVAQL